jgi:hypothetical protein
MKKKFDCVQMKRRGQRRIRAAVEGMTHGEEVAYFRAGAGDFSRRLKEAKTKARAASPGR